MDYLPDNRESAALLWIFVALMWSLSRRDLRNSFMEVLRAILHPKILLSFGATFGYIALVVWVGSGLGLWRSDLVKPTVLWAVLSGVAMLFNFRRASDGIRFFRGSVLGVLGIGAFLEFVMNLTPMNLMAEIVLQPVVVLLTLMSVVAAQKEEHRSVRQVADAFLAVIGFSVLGFTAHQVYLTWASMDGYNLILQLALPVWLTLGLLPFIYAFTLFVGYEAAFMWINRAATNRAGRWRAKFVLLVKLNIRAHNAQGFAWQWARKLVAATTIAAALQVVTEYLKSRQDTGFAPG